MHQSLDILLFVFLLNDCVYRANEVAYGLLVSASSCFLIKQLLLQFLMAFCSLVDLYLEILCFGSLYFKNLLKVKQLFF